MGGQLTVMGAAPAKAPPMKWTMPRGCRRDGASTEIPSPTSSFMAQRTASGGLHRVFL